MRNISKIAIAMIIGVIMAGFAPIFTPAARAAARQSRMDFGPIRQELPATAGWIRIFETSVNYPVMRCADNEYYLTHLPNGEKGQSGSIFLDYRNTANFSDRNTLIYGHNMRNGTMFGLLQNYNDQSFFSQHQVGVIFTPQGDYQIMFFAAYSFDQQDETAPILFADEAEFDNFVNDAKRRSKFKSSADVKWGDRLVTLVTCEYTHKDGRLIVVGKLEEI